MNYKQVVTSFLTTEQGILILRRSQKVGTHRGKWSAVSGHLEGEEEPLQRAVTEIQEELGLTREEVKLVRAGQILRAFDQETDTVWIIHPFLFEARSNRVELDWENTEYRWVNQKNLDSYQTVPRLREAYDRVRYDSRAVESFGEVFHSVEELARDRIHGASFLGHRAVELLQAAAKVSDASDADQLFSHLLLVSSRLRKAQPAMANVWNLTGQLLHVIDSKRHTVPVTEFKRLVAEHSQKILERAEDVAEDASRNTAHILPEDGIVLTHSYSSVIYRALELGLKSGKTFQVYATESYPGMEGERLAEDLVALGVPVKLIADSAVNSIIPHLNLVLVGADSVLQNGSLIHKIGTRNIAIAAKRHGISVWSVGESTK
ncbi:MAG TPA: NUDIX domain-containing protein, partial [Candidatus Bathyarchaeia archaeon]|nr:NUDIX domain-containing protein [Candidatus Bathyarchaeia archaeon]